jgi:hypothetical protein
MPPDPRAIHISTDGSCYKNPGGRSGCAAIVHYPDHLDREDEQIVDFGCEESSNNRMELLSCIRVLKWIRESGPWPSVTRVPYIDFPLTINATESLGLARLVVGPTPHANLAVRAAKALLQARSVTCPEPVSSEIPFRNW